VQLHPVEPGALRIFGSRDIVGDHARNLVEAQRACFFELEPPDRRVRAAFALRCRSRHRLLAVVEHRMDQPAHVPQLRDDAAARGMDCLGDGLPAFDLRIGPQPRRRRPAEPFLRNSRRFGDDQPGRGALAIIFNRKFVGDEAGAGTAARQRRHDDAVGRVDRAKLDRVKKRCGHRFHLSLYRRRPVLSPLWPPKLWMRRPLHNGE